MSGPLRYPRGGPRIAAEGRTAALLRRNLGGFGDKLLPPAVTCDPGAAFAVSAAAVTFQTQAEQLVLARLKGLIEDAVPRWLSAPIDPTYAGRAGLAIYEIEDVIIRGIVKGARLKFACGGWCSPDNGMAEVAINAGPKLLREKRYVMGMVTSSGPIDVLGIQLRGNGVTEPGGFGYGLGSLLVDGVTEAANFPSEIDPFNPDVSASGASVVLVVCGFNARGIQGNPFGATSRNDLY